METRNFYRFYPVNKSFTRPVASISTWRKIISSVEIFSEKLIELNVLLNVSKHEIFFKENKYVFTKKSKNEVEQAAVLQTHVDNLNTWNSFIIMLQILFTEKQY